MDTNVIARPHQTAQPKLNLDEVDDFQADDDAEVIAVEFTELAAGINPDYRAAKSLLREHPAVTEILVDYFDDDQALKALIRLASSWDIPVPDAAPEGGAGHPVALPDQSRRCAQLGNDGTRCPLRAEVRKGNRGPHPKRCAAHRIARKKWQDNGNSKPRESYGPCCKAYQADRGPDDDDMLCPQHGQHRDVLRELAWQDYPLEAIAAVYLREGFHVEPPAPIKGWSSARGPWEGRTREKVIHADPADDQESAQWLKGHRGWITGRTE